MKLPKSDVGFAVDFWVVFSSFFLSKEKGPTKSTKKSPLDFLQKPPPDNREGVWWVYETAWGMDLHLLGL